MSKKLMKIMEITSLTLKMKSKVWTLIGILDVKMTLKMEREKTSNTMI